VLEACSSEGVLSPERFVALPKERGKTVKTKQKRHVVQDTAM